MLTVYKGGIPFETDEARLTERLHLAGETAAELGELVRRSAAGVPKAVVRQVSVRPAQGGVLLSGAEERLIEGRAACALLGCRDRAWCYVVTCGQELDALARAESDPLRAWLQDQINQDVLRQARLWTQRRVCASCGVEKLASVNPGSTADWPVSGQAELFALIGGVEGHTGVRLTEGFLMHPVKSVSGIWFEAPAEGYENCQLCPRQDCPGRRADYSPERAARILGQ